MSGSDILGEIKERLADEALENEAEFVAYLDDLVDRGRIESWEFDFWSDRRRQLERKRDSGEITLEDYCLGVNATLECDLDKEVLVIYL